MTCDHILGVAINRVTEKESGEVLAVWKTTVLASQANWKSGSPIVSLWWSGDKYKFCPMCAEPLGHMITGMAAQEKGE